MGQIVCVRRRERTKLILYKFGFFTQAAVFLVHLYILATDTKICGKVVFTRPKYSTQFPFIPFHCKLLLDENAYNDFFNGGGLLFFPPSRFRVMTFAWIDEENRIDDCLLLLVFLLFWFDILF
ncbi:hypothetical protein H0G86_007902 [Trichoderma simmonsii]|uniref:Uncharacterized protein n=1 Tax=Trichoderma simmonsii TaxID=1491479 RepID=A0A8G0LEE6_9HYPO|nr:hypothetical protein H0G86_007902 [Trichoderma simmonsii]